MKINSPPIQAVLGVDRLDNIGGFHAKVGERVSHGHGVVARIEEEEHSGILVVVGYDAQDQPMFKLPFIQVEAVFYPAFHLEDEGGRGDEIESNVYEADAA